MIRSFIINLNAPKQQCSTILAHDVLSFTPKGNPSPLITEDDSIQFWDEVNLFPYLILESAKISLYTLRVLDIIF